MTIDLQELAARESEQVEWKENVADVADVVRTLVAFANDLANLGGGYVVCGAAEGKDPHGFQRVSMVGLEAARLRELEGKVLDWCRARVDPPLAPRVDEFPTEDPVRRVLVFTIAATRHAHQYRDSAGSRHYVRIGRETREARNGLLLQLLTAKGAMEPWDRTPHPSASVDDLDLLALRETLVRMGSWDPSRPVETWLDPSFPLSSFVPSLCAREPLSGAVRPRNFALLLFGRQPQRFFPQAHAVFSMYPGVDRAEAYSERLTLDGTLLSQASRLIDRLNVEAITVIDKSSGQRPNVVKYPERALHEAVINALVHRDYTLPQPVRVTAFADRVEIWSPGALPRSVTPEAFERGAAPPVWRNQALAWIFLKLHLAQNEGQGIPTILRTMQEEGNPRPRFEITAESVVCSLPAHPRHARMRELQKVEALISLGRLDEADAALARLLTDDPFNFRAIALLCEIARSSGDLAAVDRFVAAHRDRLERLPAPAQLALADALTSGRGDLPAARRDAALALLRLAAQARVELGDLRRLVIASLVLKEEGTALDALQRALHEHPEWEADPSFLQLRGRTWLLFAKRCRATAGRRRLTPRLRENARRDLTRYLDRAERDLQAAIDHGAAGAVLDHARDDLAFLARLRARR